MNFCVGCSICVGLVVFSLRGVAYFGKGTIGQPFGKYQLRIRKLRFWLLL